MEILVFALVFSKLNLVLTEDNVAVENTVAPKDDRNAHTARESNDFLNDQLAESSQSITQAFGNIVVSDNPKETHDEIQHHARLSQEVAGIGRAIQSPDGFRSDASILNTIQVLQPGSHQGHVQPQQTHQLYLQYPTQQVQIFGAEASPLQQARDDESPQALGYSSYVEHLSEKDEEEIKSALKDGSVSDIKRLVPKSGISFKIYKSDKNPEKQNPERQSNLPTHFGLKPRAEVSVLHHRIRGELPASPLGQTQVYRPSPLEDLQPSPLKNGNGEEHEGSEHGQQLLQSHGEDQQSLNAQGVHYAQPVSHKTLSGINGQSPSVARPHFRINVAESNYNRQATAAELHRNLKSSGKSSKLSSSAAANQKQWNINGKIGDFPKAVKPVKSLESLHYAADPLQTEDSKGSPYLQNHGSGSVGYNFNGHKGENSFAEAAKHDFGNYLLDSHVAKTSENNFAGQFANAAHSDQKVALNLLSENHVRAERTKPGRVIGQMVSTAYTDDAFKSGSLGAIDSETAKADQYNLITPDSKSSYVETKNSHTFDHQKALEGSTPFDIKNAIDGSGSLIHQTNYLSPTTSEIHSLENLQEKPLTYIISKIPTSTLVIGGSIPDTVVESHQIKDFGHAGLQTPSPQLSFHYPTAEVGGKFQQSPQTFLWTSEYFKHGNALTSKDFHQQLLRLHLPKEEIHVKTPSVEFPVSVVSQVTLPQQKQPLAFHHGFPFVKSFPQELHFQGKTKTRVQPNPISHLKPGQSVPIDWSLVKSGWSNFGISPLGMKPELVPHVQESGKKKIVPILVRRRKNRSNSKQEIGVVYGKVNANRRPKKPNHRQEKNVRGNVLPEGSSNVKQLETRGERKNEFSVSASYKVDRSSKSS